jgi:hypothetical protein
MSLAQIFASDLRGNDYLAARGLPLEAAQVICDCPTCRQVDLLPAVQRILAAWPAPRQ